ncbi:hypothetical protein ACK17P_23850 [Escherichia coli]|uniref:hypothetical protein n=1 Tax=Escherichia coli TaxID=562 RepID=UPI00390B19D9
MPENQGASDRSGRAAPVAPETYSRTPDGVGVTAPDGAVNLSAATPVFVSPLWTFRGLE